MLLSEPIQFGGRDVGALQPGPDRPQFLQDRAQQLLGSGGGGVEHLHRHLLDAEHVTGEAGHLMRVEQQGFLLIAAVLGIELAWIERRVEMAWIGVGVAVHRSSGPVEGPLNLIDADQGLPLEARLTAEIA